MDPEADADVRQRKLNAALDRHTARDFDALRVDGGHRFGFLERISIRPICKAWTHELPAQEFATTSHRTDHLAQGITGCAVKANARGMDVGITTIGVATDDIGAEVATLLTGPAWSGHRVVELGSMGSLGASGSLPVLWHGPNLSRSPQELKSLPEMLLPISCRFRIPVATGLSY